MSQDNYFSYLYDSVDQTSKGSGNCWCHESDWDHGSGLGLPDTWQSSEGEGGILKYQGNKLW
jgi:hypothetical protein